MDKIQDRATDPWRQLVDYESHDLVKRRYEKLHRCELSSATAKDITSLFAQGKEYFRNVANAAFSVHPHARHDRVLSWTDLANRLFALPPQFPRPALNYRETRALGGKLFYCWRHDPVDCRVSASGHFPQQLCEGIRVQCF